MAELRIDGPIEVDPNLAMKLFESMPKIGQEAVAQMFASRLMSGPLTDKAIETAARVHAERMKIAESSAKALREAVAAKCREWGEKQVNPEAVQAIVDDETRRAAGEAARSKVESLISAIPLEALIEAVTPAVRDVVKALAQQYFLRTTNGQKAVMDLIETVLRTETDTLSLAVQDRLQNAVAGPLARRMESRLGSVGGDTGNGST